MTLRELEWLGDLKKCVLGMLLYTVFHGPLEVTVQTPGEVWLFPASFMLTFLRFDYEC